MRYLLDTCVVASALRFRLGASNLILRWALEGRLPVVIHYKLLSEYREVLGRMVADGGIPFTGKQVDRFLASLVGVADEITIRFLWRPNLRDEGDNFVFETAVAASPCTIVTHNARDFESPELRWPDVEVRTPQQLIQERKTRGGR